MFRHLATAVAFSTLTVLTTSAIRAQGPPPGGPDQPDRQIDPAVRGEVIDALVDALKRDYVFPETADKMIGDLQKRREAGEYDKLESARAFADALTSHLREISKDKHLHVNYSHEPVPTDLGDGPRRPTADDLRFMNRMNYGFEKAERLEGNVGYLQLGGFVPAELGGETAAAAMTFLAGTDALIVDLRRNGGGDPSMVAFLSSYLFDGEPVHLNSLYDRPTDRTHQWWTLPHVPGRRFGGQKPVYVLTSDRTFSAAEEFTYNLKTLKRATIVGETTGGGAHPGGFRRLSEYFGAFVPSGRAINPTTETNWEGTGIAPDVQVDEELALKAAHLAALEQIAAADGNGQSADPFRADQFRRSIERLKGELEAAQPTGDQPEKP